MRVRVAKVQEKLSEPEYRYYRIAGLSVMTRPCMSLTLLRVCSTVPSRKPQNMLSVLVIVAYEEWQNKVRGVFRPSASCVSVIRPLPALKLGAKEPDSWIRSRSLAVTEHLNFGDQTLAVSSSVVVVIHHLNHFDQKWRGTAPPRAQSEDASSRFACF